MDGGGITEKSHSLQVGDFYMKDGSLIGKDATLTDREKAACVGIVFYAGKHSLDDCDYTASGIGSGAIHGYVVALKDAGRSVKWKNLIFDQRVGASTDNTDWKGYYNQTKIEAYASTTIGWRMTYFPAANVCKLWGTENDPSSKDYVAPNNSSGWFLPSTAMLLSILQNRGTLKTYLTKVYGKDFGFKHYWSSTEYGSSNDHRAWMVGYGHYDGRAYDCTVLSDTCTVRSVLTF